MKAIKKLVVKGLVAAGLCGTGWAGAATIQKLDFALCMDSYYYTGVVTMPTSETLGEDETWVWARLGDIENDDGVASTWTSLNGLIGQPVGTANLSQVTNGLDSASFGAFAASPFDISLQIKNSTMVFARVAKADGTIRAIGGVRNTGEVEGFPGHYVNEILGEGPIPVACYVWNSTENKLVLQPEVLAVQMTDATVALTNDQWYVAYGRRSFSQGITVSGSAHLVLGLGANVALDNVTFAENATLSVYDMCDPSDGIECIRLRGKFSLGVVQTGAGVTFNVHGGGVTWDTLHCDTVNVYGGILQAEGDAGHPAMQTDTALNVYGGRVFAEYPCNLSIAAIGGGVGESGSAVHVYGGWVEACGGPNAPGIGAGEGGASHGELTIAEGMHAWASAERGGLMSEADDYRISRERSVLITAGPSPVQAQDFAVTRNGSTFNVEMPGAPDEGSCWAVVTLDRSCARSMMGDTPVDESLMSLLSRMLLDFTELTNIENSFYGFTELLDSVYLSYGVEYHTGDTFELDADVVDMVLIFRVTDDGWRHLYGIGGAKHLQDMDQAGGEIRENELEDGSIRYYAWDDSAKRLVRRDRWGYTLVTSEMTTLESGWYVVQGQVTIDRSAELSNMSGLEVNGDVHLILCDGAELVVTGAHGAGICVERDDSKTNSLTIYGQVNQSGRLTATGSSDRSGIGCGFEKSPGDVTVNGGFITAVGGIWAAGIGGGGGAAGGNVTINGGTVVAYSQKYGAGIGGGSDEVGCEVECGTGGQVTINGGSVTAFSSFGGAGIGGGYCSTGATVRITGGEVTAIAYPLEAWGHGIHQYLCGDAIGAGGVVLTSGVSIIDHPLSPGTLDMSGCEGEYHIYAGMDTNGVEMTEVAAGDFATWHTNCYVHIVVDESPLPTEVPDYLAFTARGGTVTIRMEKFGNVTPPALETAMSPMGPWTAFTAGETQIPLAADTTVYFRRSETTPTDRINGFDEIDPHWAFTMTPQDEGATVAASGNIMSLLDQTCQSDTVGVGAFRCLFIDEDCLVTAPELPATNLAKRCYELMFKGCTALTNAPALPAKELAESCYGGMFFGCTALKNAPALPAMTLKYYCYSSMFHGCTALTTAPELPAMKLVESCYGDMFSDCTALTTAPELPATTLAPYCYETMFEGCTALTDAPELAATTLKRNCYASMFSGCTALTNAPALPAATLLNNYSYRSMFSGCTNVDFVSVGFTNWVSNAMKNWLDNVAETGTFEAPYELNVGVERSASTIPEGWNVVGGHVECTLPAMDGGVYVVSNLTEGAAAAAIAPKTGSSYWLPVGARVEIYCVPAEGYVIHGANPYVIPAVAADTVIDPAVLPGTRIAEVSVEYYDWNGEEVTGPFVTNAIPVTSDITELNSGWYVVNSRLLLYRPNLTEPAFKVNGDVHLILADGMALLVGGGENAACIEVGVNGSVTNSLTIYGQKDQTGRLDALSGLGSRSACIGGREGQACGTVTINGGIVTAMALSGGAGIGGGLNAAGGTVTVHGGEVTVHSMQGEAIGAGSESADPGAFVLDYPGAKIYAGASGVEVAEVAADDFAMWHTNAYVHIVEVPVTPQPETLNALCLGIGTNVDRLVQNIAQTPAKQAQLGGFHDRVVETLRAHPDLAPYLALIGNAALDALCKFSGEPAEQQEELNLINALFDETAAAVCLMNAVPSSVCDTATLLFKAADYREDEIQYLREAFGMFVEILQGRPEYEAEALGATGAAMMKVIHSSSEDDVLALPWQTMEEVSEGIRGLSPAKAAALGLTGAGLMEGVVRQPEVAEDMLDAFSYVRDAITSSTAAQALTLGMVGEAMLEGVSRQPEVFDSAFDLFSDVEAAVAGSTAEQAQALALIGVEMMNATARQPEMINEVRDTFSYISSRIVGLTGGQALALGLTGAGLMEGISRQPGMAGELNNAFFILEESVVGRTDAQAQALGQTGAGLMRAIARQPGAADKLYKAFSNTVDFVTGLTDAQAQALGMVGEAMMDALGRQPDLIDQIDAALDEVMASIAGSTPAQAQAFGTAGVVMMTELGRFGEFDNMRVAYAKLVEAVKGRSDAQVKVLGEAGGALQEAVSRQSAAMSDLIKLFTQVADAIKDIPDGEAVAHSELVKSMMLEAWHYPDVIGLLEQFYLAISAKMHGLDPTRAAAVGKLGSGLMKSVYALRDNTELLLKMLNDGVRCITVCPPRAAEGIGIAECGIMSNLKKVQATDALVSVEVAFRQLIKDVSLMVRIVSAKSARTEGAWIGAAQVVYELRWLQEAKQYALEFDLTAAGQFGSCTTNLPSAVVDGIYTQDVNRTEFFGPESQVEDLAAELTLKLIEKD